VAGFFAAISLAEARQALESLATAEELVRVLVESEADGGRRPTASYAVPNWKARLRRAERALAKPNAAVRLLAPFDPVARDRKRLARLFDFEYRFEAFTPGHKRIHGYYVLPILAGDKFIARADLKHDRRERILRVNYLKWEPGAPRLNDALDEELLRLAAFIGADRVKRGRVGR
jgi:hypothetical protein